MPTDPKPELVAAQIVENLSAIEGSAYHYPGPQAVRADRLDSKVLGAGHDRVYFLTPVSKAEERATNDGNGCIIRARGQWMLTLCGRTYQGSTNPFKPDIPIPATIQERMAADVRLKLRADPSLGGLSMDLTLTESEENPNDTTVEGWAIVFMLVSVTYHYRKDSL